MMGGFWLGIPLVGHPPSSLALCEGGDSSYPAPLDSGFRRNDVVGLGMTWLGSEWRWFWRIVPLTQDFG